MQDHKTQVRELSDAELDAVAAGGHLPSQARGESARSLGAGSASNGNAAERTGDTPAEDVLGGGSE